LITQIVIKNKTSDPTIWMEDLNECIEAILSCIQSMTEHFSLEQKTHSLGSDVSMT